MAGLLLVDLHLLAERHDLPEWISKLAPYKTILSYIFLTIGVYLGGAPAFGSDIEPYRNSFGWHYLSYLKPSAVFTPKAFYLFWGGLFTVASIPNVPYLKAFFELRPIQYLGKVSYAFYLCHGPVLWTIGDRTYAAVGWIRSNHAAQYPFWVNLLKLPAWGPVGLEFNFLVAQLLLLPTTLWLAGMVTRAIDEPILKVLGQGYRSLCTEKPREGIEMSQA
jgi:peptidoglycan/LPS O-acetylase OafA/YrhL